MTIKRVLLCVLSIAMLSGCVSQHFSYKSPDSAIKNVAPDFPPIGLLVQQDDGSYKMTFCPPDNATGCYGLNAFNVVTKQLHFGINMTKAAQGRHFTYICYWTGCDENGNYRAAMRALKTGYFESVVDWSGTIYAQTVGNLLLGAGLIFGVHHKSVAFQRMKFRQAVMSALSKVEDINALYQNAVNAYHLRHPAQPQKATEVKAAKVKSPANPS